MYNNIFIDALVQESEKLLAEASRVDTSPYETVNDETPKGRGTWSFGIDAYPKSPVDYSRLEKDGKIVDVTDDYRVARDKVQKDNPSAKIIYVLP